MTKRISEISGTNLAFEMEDTYRTKDEIQVLAEAFATLSKRTRDYIDQITKITAEKERIGAELELATRIQADMLPNIFPAFPEREEFDIYATMTPAKEVGGDFYDFFLIDNDHLGMVMADVSGKGVPAALFMMMSKILVNNFAMMGSSPAKVLEQVNTQICKNNDEEMFVTVWFGVLEISTGKITAANAGHEYPIIKKPDGSFELFKDKHGFVIGGMEGVKYRQYELQLQPGSKLFLYTDGVPEATSAETELFGTDRMLAALNTAKDKTPVDVLQAVQDAVDEFVKDAEQFDDLTMLCLQYQGPEVKLS
jgi:sigma-B regulation protein RsbU (phosphoserine phosphatase)